MFEKLARNGYFPGFLSDTSGGPVVGYVLQGKEEEHVFFTLVWRKSKMRISIPCFLCVFMWYVTVLLHNNAKNKNETSNIIGINKLCLEILFAILPPKDFSYKGHVFRPYWNLRNDKIIMAEMYVYINLMKWK